MAAALARTSNRSRAIALLTVLALVWVLTNAIGPHAAQGAANVNVQRIAGNDRYETAAALALQTFPSGAQVVVLARGDDFPDALAGNFVAGADPGSPILLTPHDSLHPATLNALKTLKATTVIVLGGESAVNKSVTDALTSNGFQVTRIQGTDRYDTASHAATQGGDIGQLNGQNTAIVASGENFADALAGGPISYSEGFPTLLTQKDVLPEATRQQLVDLQIKHVLLLGGEQRISAAVANQITSLGITVERIFGNTRQATAAMIAQFALDQLGYGGSRVILTRGDNFADPLASGPFGGENLETIYLTVDPNTLGTDTQQGLASRNDEISEIDVISGELGITNATADQAKSSSTCTPVPTSTTTSTTTGGITLPTLSQQSKAFAATDTATSTTTTTTPTATSTTTSNPPKVCQPGSPPNVTSTTITGTSTTITGTATSTTTTLATATTTTL